jgi:hypothetical protein
MNRVEQLEQQIAALDPAELKALRAWFERYDAEVWDRQIESESCPASLSVLRDHEAERSTDL